MMKMQAQFFYPQRPKLCARSLLGRFLREPERWRAELKLNGDRCVVIVTGDGRLEFWNRHGEQFKRFRPPAWMREQLLDTLPTNTVLDGELLHLRTKDLKNRLALFDVIMFAGELMITETQQKRWEVLDSLGFPIIFGPPHREAVFVLRRMPVAVAWRRARQYPASWVEGIVVKDRHAPAAVGLHRAPTAQGWFKVRRPKSGLYVL